MDGIPLNELLELGGFNPAIKEFFTRLLACSEERYKTIEEVREGLERSGLFVQGTGAQVIVHEPKGIMEKCARYLAHGARKLGSCWEQVA